MTRYYYHYRNHYIYDELALPNHQYGSLILLTNPLYNIIIQEALDMNAMSLRYYHTSDTLSVILYRPTDLVNFTVNFTPTNIIMDQIVIQYHDYTNIKDLIKCTTTTPKDTFSSRKNQPTKTYRTQR